MAEPYDSWHRQPTKRGERRCRDHDQTPSANHGRGMRWVARWRDSNGRQRSTSFESFDQARRHQRKMETATRNGRDPDAQNTDLSLANASTSWLARRKPQKSRTIAQYASQIQNHIDDPIGDLRLHEIKPSTIADWINGRRAAGLDETTIALILTHLSAILQQCVDDELISRNPCRAGSMRGVKPKRSKKSSPKVPLTGRQVTAVRNALPARYKALTDVGRALGLRQGEIFGLGPDDIDWVRKRARIHRQVAHDGNHLVFAALKASEPREERERWVPVPDELAFRLIAHMADFPPVEVTLPWETADGPKRTATLFFTSRESKALNGNYFNWV